MTVLIKVLGILTSVLIFSLILGRVFGLNDSWEDIIFFLATLAVSPLLLRALFLTRNFAKRVSFGELFYLRSHIILHIIPIVFSYFRIKNVNLDSQSISIAIPAFLLFFYTGRKTWQTLNKLSPAMLYSIFCRGNSMIMLPVVISSLSFYIFNNFKFIRFLEGLFLFYSTIHFVLIGVALLKINKDFAQMETKS